MSVGVLGGVPQIFPRIFLSAYSPSTFKYFLRIWRRFRENQPLNPSYSLIHLNSVLVHYPNLIKLFPQF
jgi:hypothetical protein